MRRDVVLLLALALGATNNLAAQRAAEARDLLRVREVSDPQLSPDGAWVAYTVTTADTVRDRQDRDVWMTSWDGVRTVRITSSPEKEHAPRWSPDGRYLAFLSARTDPREVEQLWLLDRAGGEAQRISDLPGGVSDYAWSPDGKRIALIAADPEPDAGVDSSQRRPRPIVVDRFAFKYDGEGFIGPERDHLYLFDLSTRQAELVTPGPYDEMSPAWSPDGRSIAFVSRRRPEYDRTDNWDIYVVAATPGAEPRQLTTFTGADMDPEWGNRAPSWSPDGKLLAYVQGGRPELIYYAGQKVAVVPVDGGPARVLTGELDRNVLMPTFAPDGRSLLFLLEDDRVYHLARVPLADEAGGGVERLVTGSRAITDLSVGRDGRIAVTASTTAQPDEVFAVDGNGLRKLSRQNDAWLAGLRLAPVEEISVRSRDGTEIHGFMVKPADYQPGHRYPTVLRIHGGPVWQFYHDFANLDWQVLAAAGYVVLGVNPRGSSGRGEKFATAIWADWGGKDGEDVLAAVDWAVEQGVADRDRLGVGGWSYGGILTDQLIVRDHRFKAAISGAGQGNAIGGYGTDMYAIEYEAELGKPWQKPETWRRVSSPFLHADRIVTPTLFLCGDEDWNVPLSNSEQMYQALKSLGRETELVVYPGEAHDIERPSFRQDRMERYLAWYGKYLALESGEPTASEHGGGVSGQRRR